MKQLSTEQLISSGISRYSLVIGIAKRARQISAYNDAMGIQTDEKPVMLAALQFADHDYDIMEVKNKG